MHTQTHILSGWCVGNLFNLTPRERALCTVAAAWHDLDGLGIIPDRLLGTELYWDLHHTLGHNLLFGVIVSGMLALLSTHRLKAMLIYVGLFHLHLLMDLFGSGEGWRIYYLWPFSNAGFKTDYVWALSSWQNYAAAGVLLAWTIGLIYLKRRTPLEAVMPSLDRQLVQIFHRRRAAREPITP